jgi:hypothetical protein
MTLRKARLCLDCEELHDQRHCPICASEAYAFLTQWVPAPERRKRPRSASIACVGVAPRVSVSSGPAGVLAHTVLRWARNARYLLDNTGMHESGEWR